MRQFRRLACIGAIAVLVVLLPTIACGQRGKHGSTEISMMHGFVLASSGGDNDKATIIMTPVPPVWRMTFWTRSPLIIETGFSFLSATSEGDNATILNLEAGVGANLGSREAKTVPCASLVGGVVMISISDEESDTHPYIGAQFGARMFIRDYAAVRIQTSLRHVFVEGGDGTNLIEVVAGFSFFL